MKKSTSVVLIVFSVFVFILFSCNYSRRNVTEEVKKTDSVASKNLFSADSFAYYESNLAKDSLNVELRLALANNYYVEKRYDKALGHLLILYGMDSKNLKILTGLGNVYYDTEDYNNAVKYYEKELSLDPNNVDVRCDLATCYLNMKKPEISLGLLKKNIKINPKHIQSHHNLAVVYGQLGKSKEAEEEMAIYNSLTKEVK
jgi:tetratricopeptide (TPR) repeat protein